MGSGSSASPRSGGLRQAPPTYTSSSGSPLRGLGFEDPASPFAAPPRVFSDETGSSQQGASRLPVRAPSPTKASSPTKRLSRLPEPPTKASSPIGATSSSSACGDGDSNPDLELGTTSDLKDSAVTGQMWLPDVGPEVRSHDSVVRGQLWLADIGDDPRNQDAILDETPPKMSLKSFDPPREGSVTPSADHPRPTPSAEHRRRSLAKGASASRPRWTRPRPATAGGTLEEGGSRPSSSDSSNLITDPSLHKLEDFTFTGEKGSPYEPPSTPSTTISDSGLNCTQSSLWSGSGWGSRPSTCLSAASSSNFWGGGGDPMDLGEDRQEVVVDCARSSLPSRSGWGSRPNTRSSVSSSNFWGGGRDVVVPEDEHDGLVDCTRDSRMRASGIPNGDTLLRLSSAKQAWVPESP